MLIDVQEPGLNLVLNGCFYGLVLVAALSLFPWRLRHGGNRWALWLPLAALALYAGYEGAMPARMNIRLDLALILPLLGIITIAWLIRLVMVRRGRRRAPPS
jgi:hypothetical protein